MEGNYKKWINRINSKQDVLTEDNVGQFMDLELTTKLTPTSGDTVLARDILTNKAVEIPITSLGGGGSGLALGETSSTAYRGDRGKIAYDHSQTTGNPHGTTKSDIGLGNVPNLDTTNAVNNSHTHSNKSILDLITEPFTTSLKSLYDGVVTSINNLLLTGQRLITSGEITKLSNTSGTNTGDETTSSIQTKRPLKTIEGQSLEGSGNIDLTKSDIGLGNVDNTSDLNKPISTATQTSLNLKANLLSPTFTGTVSGITATMVGAPNGSGNSTGINTGDNAVNTLYSGLVSNATHTGDVTGATALIIANNVVSNAKLAQMGANTFKANNTGSTANATDITVAQAKTLLAISNTDVSGLGTLSTQSGTFTSIPQANITNLTTDLASKQATLVSATNIKTINGNSLLGSGDLIISGGGSSNLDGLTDVIITTPINGQTLSYDGTNWVNNTLSGGGS